MRDTVQPIRAAPYFSFSADGGFLRVSPSVSMLFFRRDLKHAMPKKGASIETCFSPFPALALSKTSVPPVSRPTGSEGQFFSGRRTCGEQEKNAAYQQHPDLRRTGGAGPSEENMRKSGVGSSEKPVKTVRFLSSSIDKAKQKQYNINEHLFYCR